MCPSGSIEAACRRHARASAEQPSQAPWSIFGAWQHRQSVYFGWDKQLMFCVPVLKLLPPTMRFSEVVDAVLRESYVRRASTVSGASVSDAIAMPAAAAAGARTQAPNRGQCRVGDARVTPPGVAAAPPSTVRE